MEFDYSKLLGRIREYGHTQDTLAKAIGITESTMSLKLNNKAPFKQVEIRMIAKVLEIPDSDIGAYFFCSESSEKPNRVRSRSVILTPGQSG